MAVERRKRQTLQDRFEAPFWLKDNETYFAVLDNRSKVVAQGSYELMTKTHKTLPPAFPSAPGGPKAEHEVKVYRKGKMVLSMGFAATYSAKKFIEAMLLKDKPKWINPHILALEDIDLEIHCTELEDIIEHDYTKDEAAWNLPEPYPQQALRARG